MFLFQKVKMVLIVRSDLKLTKGKIASQCAHAAVMAFKNTLDSKPSLANSWFKLGQPKIVLKVDTLEDLENLNIKAIKSGIISVLVHDAGRTQIAAGTVTALGLGPDKEENIDALVKELKLL